MAENYVHKSGAKSGKLCPPYGLVPMEGEENTALRFGYGNAKHENNETVYREANWMKAFHSRDLPFFRDRMGHAAEHLRKEMQGSFDTDPGGNLGAVGWCVAVMSYVRKHDYEFYLAIVGVKPHPGDRKQECGCPRCAAGSEGKAGPGITVVGSITADKPKPVVFPQKCGRYGCLLPQIGCQICDQCEDHCKCL